MANGSTFNPGLLADAFAALGGRSTNYGQMATRMQEEERRKKLLASLLAGQGVTPPPTVSSPEIAPARLPAAVGLGQIGDAAGLNEYQRNQLAGAQMMQQQAGAKGLMMTPSGFQRMPQPIPVPAGVPTTPPAPTVAPTVAPTTAAGMRLTPQARQIAAALPTDQALAFLAKEANKTYTGPIVDVNFQGRTLQFRQDDPRLMQYLAAGGTRLKEGVDPAKKLAFGQEKDLRKEFDDLSKDFDEGYTAFQKVARSATKQNPTGADDIALIFGFMKTVDPGSVVREGEFATAENSAGVPARVRNMYNSALEGLRLTPTQRLNFLNAARSQVEPLVARQNQIEQTFKGIAQRGDLNVENVVRTRLPKVGSYYNPIPVANEEEANKLPKGTFVTINGRIARVF